MKLAMLFHLHKHHLQLELTVVFFDKEEQKLYLMYILNVQNGRQCYICHGSVTLLQPMPCIGIPNFHFSRQPNPGINARAVP